MKIAVSMTVMENPTYAETRDTLSQDWVRFLESVGVAPVLVSNELSDPAQFCREMNVSGILLTSGNDIGLQPNEVWEPSDSVSEKRDRTELALMEHAVKCNTPLIGICRGLQIINTYFGGTLERDLANSMGGEHHVRADHSVEVVDADYEAKLGVRTFVTNSYHNHGVSTNGLSKELRPIALSPHGVVEALYHPSLSVLGTQWHPERKSPDPELGSALFRQWLETCANPAGSKI
jgi:putative glutamine amidotransferase